MMDRFKFRIWRQENLFVKNWQPKYVYLTLGSESGFLETDVIEQCTGLKDKKGKLIYEGDIVKQYDRHKNMLRIGWIVYDVNEMKFKIRTERSPDWNDKADDYTFHPLKQKLEIIGNIHEQGDKTDE